MEELMDKVDNLINSLEETKEIQEIKEWNQKIEEEKELKSLIEEYRKTQDESVKEKIRNHPFYREYKKKENACNFLILEINQTLKEITGKGKSCNENH